MSFFSKNLLLAALFVFLTGFIMTVVSSFVEVKILLNTLSKQGEGQVGFLAQSFPAEVVKQAQDNQSNPSHAVHQTLTRHLDALSSANPNIGQAYLLSPDPTDGKLQIVAAPTKLIERGLQVGSSYEPPPLYLDSLQHTQSSRTPATVQPYFDAYGHWMTFLAPVIENGAVIGLLSIDMDASVLVSSQMEMIQTLSIAGVLVFLLIFLIQYFNIRRLLRPIGQLSAAVEAVEQGNLDIEPVQVKNQDEVGRMVRGFNDMVVKLRNSVRGELETAAEQLATAFEQVAEVSEKTSAQATDALRSLEEISASSEELAMQSEQGNLQLSKINENIAAILTRTDDAATAIASCNDESERGMRIVESLRDQSAQTEQITLDVGREIYVLEDLTHRINDLLGSIQEIAEQTSLLSLNASIEAARAGENGRGFSVVADEIRKLATNTKHSSEEISSLLSHISQGVSSTGQKMRSAEAVIQTQGAHVENTIQSFYHIRQMIDAVVRNIHQVNHAVQNVEHSKEALVETVQTFSSMSEQTAAAIEMVQLNFNDQVQTIQGLSDSCKSMEEQASRLTALFKG